MAQIKVNNGQILQDLQLDSSKGFKNFLHPRCLSKLPSRAFRRKLSLTSSTLKDEATNFQISSLSDRTTFRTMKDESQYLVTNPNSASLTKNQPSGCLSHSLNIADLLEKTKNLQSHRSLYPSISDINSIFNNQKVRHAAWHQSSIDKNCERASSLRSKPLEIDLIGLRRSTQCLLDDNDDFFNEQCYNNFFGSQSNAPIQRDGLQNLDFISKYARDNNQCPSYICILLYIILTITPRLTCRISY
jgi:hypothetical protein